MKLKCDLLNNHSPKVGQDMYDQSKKSVRVEYVRMLENLNSPKSSQNSQQVPKDAAREARKKRKAEEDDLAMKSNAERYLKHLSEKKKQRDSRGLSLRCKVRPKDRPFLMKIVYEKMFHSEVQKFPKGNTKGTRVLYCRFFALAFFRVPFYIVVLEVSYNVFN